MHELKGLYTALITPFDEEGKLDQEGLRKNISHQLDAQVDGLVLLGTTSETPALSDAEKMQILKIAKDIVHDKIPLIVGTGCNCTEKTIKNTRLAVEMGADYALIISPYYNKPMQEGIFQHFKQITKHVSLPLIVYNHKGRTGVEISIETLKRLASLPQIAGVKEVTSSIDRVNHLMDAIKSENPEFSVLSGEDSSTFTLMANGADGVISVASNAIPQHFRELVQSCLSCDFSQARGVHCTLMPLFNALSLETNPIPIKQAMNILGFSAGPCRLPLTAMESTNQQQLQKVLNTLLQQPLAAFNGQ